MRLPPRRSDDADVIRARLRALLAEHAPAPGGWVPDEDELDAFEAEDVRDPVPLDGPAEEPALPPGLGRHRAPGTAARWDIGRPGARALGVAGVLTVALLLGWTWLSRPTVEPAPTAAAAPGETAHAPSSSPSVGEVAERSATVVVSVVGQVGRPGLVTLGTGARVADAVEAAGGLLPGADPASVNLAAPLSDGQQIAVGVPGAAGPVVGAPSSGGATGGGGGRVDLNAAGVVDLDALPGIGPVLAQRIVDHRARNGPFRSVDELDDVPGIGPAIAADLAELVTV
ncbi:ComEA family DNA-binding protein [Blastococcus saxobsidens]|uniref:Competence protein ComEA n=1 Tax=Blastococcus saxobsidens TaxID=138336 RepID=A0A4Q7Y4U5_9ACTN|nr:ComEA family DNA-binding protein [Blastococcus saxobsidens]RZU30925.1 competence protein ComEA [Blastococcus saxobsidens]